MLGSFDQDLKREIGRGISEARIRRGFSQEALAERVGCPVSTITNLERGKSLPKLRTLAELSRQLGAPLRDLLDHVDLIDPTDDRRARLEIRGRALLNGLSNEFLEIAIEQISVLAKRDHQAKPDQK